MRTLRKAAGDRAPSAFFVGAMLSVVLAVGGPFASDARAAGTGHGMQAEFQDMKAEIRALQQKTNTLELRGAEKDSKIKSLETQVQQTHEDLTGMASFNFINEVEMSGYVDAVVTNVLTTPDDQQRRLGVFETNSHSFNNLGFKLVLEKPTSEEDRAGFRVDILSGETGRLLGAATTDVPTGTTGLDDFELEQAYITYKADVGDGLDIFVGKFVTLLGAEVIESPDNFNITRSILFGFAIPFTHTGIRATYPLTDTVSVTAGVNNGWDNNDDLNHGYTYEGQVAWNPNDKFGLVVNGIWGPEKVGREENKRGVIDVVATWMPTSKLTFVGNFDWGHESGVPLTNTNTIFATVNGLIIPFTGMRTGKKTADWYGAALVTNYQFTDRFHLAGRVEYFRDSDGFRTGVRQSLWEGTITPTFWVTPKLLTRIEFRTDHSNQNFFLQGGQSTGHQESVLGEVAFMFP
ncbi:MAG: outer membrane beta-barrel protein [Myxococcota bacterium]